ncbi:MAG: TerC/Alx family metal homeostasis membrane protein [Bacteroidetes bacterium]|nr:MAG: TerC/Alx family metal homeostasis membrane protein [Bacteroidota bacterium]
MLSNEILFFTGFTIFILTVLAVDLGFFSKKDHSVSFKEAGIWTLVWVSFALGFYVILKNYGYLVHGINNLADLKLVHEKYAPHLILTESYALSLQNYLDNISIEFITGYLLEYSLSADNIFVIILIFQSFQVSEKYYKKVLFWGIMGAIVMRFLFIFLGSALIQQFDWILYGFALFLLYSGGKILWESYKGGGDEQIDTKNHPVVRFASKYFSVFPRFVDQYFFIKKDKKWFLTPLFLVVIIIEFTDLLFAVDSVPAVFSVTKDPYIVFFSNIFAILGLRSMFFFLSNVMHLFHYLKYGLSVLLIFIGVKMLAHHYLKSIGFETIYSLYFILVVLAISILTSLLFPPKQEIKP